ncbi:MAG: hypothetical protein ACRCXY_09200 [Fusobacteriaceae bacterium]
MKKIIITLLMVVLGITIFGKKIDGEHTPIYPSTLSIPIKKATNIKTFTVYNTANERKTFEVSIKDVDNFEEASPIAKYLRIFPKKFSLEPGKSREIRVSIEDIPKEMLGQGEYRGALLIKGLTSKINEKYETKEKDSSISTILNVKMHISMAIYALSGNEFENVEFKSFKLNKKDGVYDTILKNTGNYSYYISMNLLDKNNKVISDVEAIKVFPGREAKLNFPIVENAENVEVKLIDKDSKKTKSIKIFEMAELLKR